MSSESKALSTRALRFVGSLWFAAVLLSLLLVGMACATVYESMHGSQRALADFYLSRWFEVLLALVAVNLSAAVIFRYPFSKWHTGFVITHAGIIITFGGALVTKHFGVNGQIGFFEGETVNEFRVLGVPTLALRARGDNQKASIDLNGSKFNGFNRIQQASAPPLTLGNVGVEVLEYLPDSEVTERMANDSAQPKAAIQVSLSPTGADDAAWIFAGQIGQVGPLKTAFRTFATEAELMQAMASAAKAEPGSDGAIKVEVEGKTFEIPLEQAQKNAMPVGDTGYSIRALRYVANATVIAGKVQNNPNPSGQSNPALQVEVNGPSGTHTEWLFAKFPDFRGMHAEGEGMGMGVPPTPGGGAAELKLTFVAPKAKQHQAGSTPVEILAGPGEALFVRFETMGQGLKTEKLTVGTPIDAPWPGQKFAVLDRLDRARQFRDVESVEPVRKDRVPAIKVEMKAGEQSEQLWVQKYQTREFKLGGSTYELTFGDKEIPLGFGLRLDHFEVGYYPGERRPRSFTSQLTIIDPVSGGPQAEVVSMNNPCSYGGYNLYQSSYRIGRTRTASFLSVARDPGLVIVFIGYSATMAGMVIVLITRSIIYRRTGQRAKLSGASDKMEPPVAGSRKSSTPAVAAVAK